MRKKLALTAVAFGLVVAACGGGSDATTTTAGSPAATSEGGSSTDAATTTTAPPPVETSTTVSAVAPVGTNEYCQRPDGTDPFDDFNPLGANLEEQVQDLLALIDQMEANAPGEIAADVAVMADAARLMAEIFAEYDYDLLSIPPDDPRFLAFQAPELEEASRNIAAYCGIDIDDVNAATDDGGIVGGIGTSELPEDFPEALVPPGLEGLDNAGAGGVFISSSATFDEAYAFYQELLGDPADQSQGSATFSGVFEGQQRIVNITDNLDGSILITIISL